jgi:Arm DNA-binding domain
MRHGCGLYLKVQPGGARSWLLRCQLAGKVHDLGLGPYPEVALARVRGKALAARRQKADGLDPLAERRTEREAERTGEAHSITFRTIAARYIAAHEAGWRNPPTLCLGLALDVLISLCFLREAPARPLLARHKTSIQPNRSG